MTVRMLEGVHGDKDSTIDEERKEAVAALDLAIAQARARIRIEGTKQFRILIALLIACLGLVGGLIKSLNH